MPPKKSTPKKDATPATPAPVTQGSASSKGKKPVTASGTKVEPAAAPTGAVAKAAQPKATSTAQPKATSTAQPKAPKPADAVPAAARVLAEATVAAEVPVQPAGPAISAEDIRHAAFLLSQRRRGPSDPVADWFEAERLLGVHSA